MFIGENFHTPGKIAKEISFTFFDAWHLFNGGGKTGVMGGLERACEPLGRPAGGGWSERGGGKSVSGK